MDFNLWTFLAEQWTFITGIWILDMSSMLMIFYLYSSTGLSTYPKQSPLGHSVYVILRNVILPMPRLSKVIYEKFATRTILCGHTCSDILYTKAPSP